MRIKNVFIVFFAAFIINGMINVSTAQDNNISTSKDGKTIFTDAKCSSCHSIVNENIITKKKGNAPDLSDIGIKLKADFIKKYLLKEEKINDKKHLIAFKGESAELDTLANWLANLKTPPKNE
ncbi:MAG: c-type cytochrome [FCB group bacterium]|jgi:CxxC motif-containing protein (DUF1111 family)